MHHRLEEDRNSYPLIYILSEGVYGVAIQVNAFHSNVRYYKGGIEYNVSLENDEILFQKNPMDMREMDEFSQL